MKRKIIGYIATQAGDMLVFECQHRQMTRAEGLAIGKTATCRQCDPEDIASTGARPAKGKTAFTADVAKVGMRLVSRLRTRGGRGV